MIGCKRFVLLAAVAATLSGCVYATAVPLKQNVWRLETDTRGGVRDPETDLMRRAAWLTIRNGYTHFLVRPATPGSLEGATVRAILYGQPTLALVGPGGTAAAVGGHPVPDDPSVRAAVDIVMLRAGDPGIEQAYQASTVLGW